jgi:signal transduction histidine kinase/ligand-binding sensor domain-containing protein
LWAILLVLLLCTPMFAIDRDRRIDELYHTSWTAKDGVPGHIHALAQTTDGFLWLGTANGLFRFDGVHFERYEPTSGQAFPKTKMSALFATPDGGLWVGYAGGNVSLLKNGSVINYDERDGLLPSRVKQLLQDSHGRIWAVTLIGLSTFDGTRWNKLTSDQNLHGDCYSAFVDRSGTLWVSTEDGLFFLPEGTDKFQLAVDGRTAGLSMAESQDGTLWIAQTEQSVHTVSLPWMRSPARDTEVRVGSIAILIDSQGSLWITTVGDGIRRVSYPSRIYGSSVAQFGPEAESFTHKQGLTNDYVISILEDREGNIWTVTNEGLDCFRQTAFVPVSLPSGMFSLGLAATDRGMVWISSANHSLMRIQDGGAVDEETLQKLGPANVRYVYREGNGSIWVSTEALLHFTNGHIDRQIIVPGDRPVAIAEDTLQRLWVTPNVGSVMRFKNGTWQTLESLGGPGTTSWSEYTDQQGTLWFGFEGNTVAKIDGDEIRLLSAKDGIQVGTVLSIQAHGSDLWIGGSGGLARFDGRRFRPVLREDGQDFKDVLAIVAIASDGLWFSENRGIIHIPANEIDQLKKEPNYRVSYRVFDFLDGIPSPPASTMFRPRAVEGTDGRIWFALTQGVVWIDPKHIPMNSLPPGVSIDSVDANGNKIRPSSLSRFAAHTTTLHIVYTASSLSVPERVRFRYKLEGQDKSWNEAGTRREAFYTNLSPGPYRFRVIACNNDGVWNDTGATWDFVIAPAFYQTIWFRVLLGLTAAGLIWLLYSLRLRQATAQVEARLGERLEERGRIARELHDTLIQSVDGLMLRIQTALNEPDSKRSHQMIEKALDSADEVMSEGRQRVQALRAEAIKVNELSEALASYGNELAEDRAVSFSVALVGSPKPVDAFVRDEAYRIGREALGNAFQHSGATRIEAEITYDRALLRLRVGDDGVGIDQQILNGGKPGHYGLTGMRERAQTLGGQLVIWSRSGAGTEIDLEIPAPVAYQNGFRSLHWIKRLIGDKRERR